MQTSSSQGKEGLLNQRRKALDMTIPSIMQRTGMSESKLNGILYSDRKPNRQDMPHLIKLFDLTSDDLRQLGWPTGQARTLSEYRELANLSFAELSERSGLSVPKLHSLINKGQQPQPEEKTILAAILRQHPSEIDWQEPRPVAIDFAHLPTSKTRRKARPLRAWREEKGLTQVQLDHLIGRTRLTRSAEAGKSKAVSLEAQLLISQALGVPLDSILWYAGEQKADYTADQVIRHFAPAADTEPLKSWVEGRVLEQGASIASFFEGTVSKSMIYAILHGRVRPSLETKIAIAETLGLTANQIEWPELKQKN